MFEMTRFNAMMKKSCCLAAALVLLAFCAAPTNALAQNPDKRTLFTFSGPVRMPGRTLPPGQYLFRLPLQNSREVLQVLSPDGSKLYGTFFIIPAIELKTPEEPQLRFMETPAGEPPAVRSWWYPGDPSGFEFIYPKHDAERLARSAKQTVLTTRSQTSTTAETETKSLSRMGATGNETNVDSTAAPVPSSSSGDVLKGVLASPTLVIPANPEVVNPEPDKK